MKPVTPEELDKFRNLVLEDGRTVDQVLAGAPVPESMTAPRPLSGRELFMQRERQGWKLPSSGPAVGGSATNLTGRDLMRARMTGKVPR